MISSPVMMSCREEKQDCQQAINRSINRSPTFSARFLQRALGLRKVLGGVALAVAMAMGATDLVNNHGGGSIGGKMLEMSKGGSGDGQREIRVCDDNNSGWV